MRLCLEPVDQANYRLILPWRNAPDVRAQMQTQHNISETEHRKWFERIQTDSTERWFICREVNSDPIGVVNFKKINEKNGTAFWGFFSAPKKPKGTGSKILHAALCYAFLDLNLAKVFADVRASNEISIHLHKKFGFTEISCSFANCNHRKSRVKMKRFSLKREDWEKNILND